MAGAFSILSVYLFWNGKPIAWASSGLAAVFVACAWAVPDRLGRLNKWWMRLAQALHAVTSPVVLGIVYFLVITPIGILLRAGGKDLLRLRAEPSAASYWVERSGRGPAAETYRDQF